MLTSVAEEASRYGTDPRFREVSLFNPNAIRGPNGIWNEDTLPVLDWESPEHRIVVPVHLQHSLALAVPPVLRWATKKFHDVISKHHIESVVIDELPRLLDGWEYPGEETGSYAGNQRILFRSDSGRSYALSIGADKSGSYNVITLISSSDPNFLRNRLRMLQRIVARAYSDP